MKVLLHLSENLACEFHRAVIISLENFHASFYHSVIAEKLVLQDSNDSFINDANPFLTIIIFSQHLKEEYYNILSEPSL